MISAIAAVDENLGIGYKNELLCNIKEDLKRFKELTTDNIVIMGSKTWESLPTKPLPNRVNIVVTNKVDSFSVSNGVMYIRLKIIPVLPTRCMPHCWSTRIRSSAAM